MRAYRAICAGKERRLLGALALLAGLGLAGCSDIDNALFGPDDGNQPGAGNAPGTFSSASAGPAPAQPQPAPATPDYSTYPSDSQPAPGTMADQSAPAPAAPPPGARVIAPIQIEQGSNTGTSVSTTVASLRSQLVGVEADVGQSAQRFAGLRAQNSQSSNTYYQAKARIAARLQQGTTKGNPELVAEWNTAQAALDQVAVNINAMNAVGTSMANDSSATHSILDQIAATRNVSGAVEEDHRQLSVLEDETNQTIVLIDRLLRDVAENVRRQTAYAANERANLTTLATAIKNGELYGADLGSPQMASASTAALANSATPLVVIRFDHPNVDYQQILYAALNQALQMRPKAAFSVVAVSPTRGSIAAVQAAQTTAKQHAQEVVRSITDMGVPASRLAVASSTDPNATASEVRVFVR
jgi:hypothetical protein